MHATEVACGNEHKANAFLANELSRQRRPLLVEHLFCLLEQRKERFPTFAMVPETRTLRALIFHLILFFSLVLFVCSTKTEGISGRSRIKDE